MPCPLIDLESYKAEIVTDCLGQTDRSPIPEMWLVVGTVRRWYRQMTLGDVKMMVSLLWKEPVGLCQLRCRLPLMLARSYTDLRAFLTHTHGRDF
jgi:hypothetical protein